MTFAARAIESASCYCAGLVGNRTFAEANATALEDEFYTGEDYPYLNRSVQSRQVFVHGFLARPLAGNIAAGRRRRT